MFHSHTAVNWKSQDSHAVPSTSGDRAHNQAALPLELIPCIPQADNQTRFLLGVISKSLVALFPSSLMKGHGRSGDCVLPLQRTLRKGPSPFLESPTLLGHPLLSLPSDALLREVICPDTSLNCSWATANCMAKVLWLIFRLFPSW